jgi:hypothetical protein
MADEVSGESGPVPIPREQWDSYVARVTQEMKDFTKKFATPISKVINHDDGQAWGTGYYIELSAQRYLLTNEHVARALTQNSLGHQFLDDDGVYRATNPFHAYELPFDVAVSRIDPQIWGKKPHGTAPIPEDKWAFAHAPVDGEILFLKGFSGSQSRFLFGTLFNNATSFGCQQVPLPAGDSRFDPRFHFAVDYRPDRATPLDGRDLPNPPGLSGSLVWNTRFIECTTNEIPWSVDQAEVTGLIWGWPSSKGCLIATRAEYVRSFLLRVVAG